MAATAYAFVVSLMNTMDQIQIHPRLSICFDNHQFESLRKNLDSLLAFVENHSDDSVMDAESSDAEDLLSRIARLAQLAEDLIEEEAADQIRDLSTNEKTQSFLLDLQRKIQEMDLIINEEGAVIKVKEEMPLQGDLQPTSSSTASPKTAKSSTMIGFDGYVNKLLDELTGHHYARRILPIVGMGGVGKTTLARNVYENLLTVGHFVVRIWVTVSQTFAVSDIFLQALSCLGGSTSGKVSKSTDDELGQRLHKNLYGRRYLIVLDDIWSVEAWERIKFYFPENKNGSRIVVTTRQQQLVDYFASSSVVVNFLDNKNSWELFCDKVFGCEQGGCPPELQQVGRMILRRCRGLPLAITVIGGLLAKSPRTQEYWEKIAKDKSLVLEYSSGNNNNNNPLSILYTSYKHLHVSLKPCFLYLGLFPEDHRINASELVKFWVAEGFIKPTRKQSLEEVAESCVKELINRNLLLAGGVRRLDKKLVTCYIHDLVREMCIRIAEKEKFYCVQRNIAGTCVFIVDERTASLYPPQSFLSKLKSPISVYHPLKFRGQNGVLLKSRLQRVMVNPVNAHCEEVNLRFICINDFVYRPDLTLPRSLSLFWSLQTIIFSHESKTIDVPADIWKMQQLRHIDIYAMRLSVPTPSATGDKDIIVLHNLQTLNLRWSEEVFMRIPKNLRWSEEVFMRIPNVKELAFCNEGSELDFHNLKKLESLVCYSYIEDPLQNLKLPNSLKELTLGYCRLAWSDVEILIGALPHLQILVLKEEAVVGSEWNLDADVEFRSLKHLKISSIQDLVTWNANRSYFPVLETLSLFGLYSLEEIPPDIREITTLERVIVDKCCKSVIMSAIKVLQEQQSLGNEDFELQIYLFTKLQAKMWREKVQKMGITSQNLHISSYL